jgi:starch-binding outer membrane protein, SusD/RagB family
MNRMHENFRFPRLRRTRVTCSLAAGMLFALSACDLSVSNPGPVADEFLNDPGAHNAVLAGISWGLSETLWKVSLLGTETTFEQTRAGRNFSGGGLKTPDLAGVLTADGMSDAYYTAAQRVRWMAEDASRRFDETLDNADSSPLKARAQLYAGNANRILGENFCVAVIDGGPVEDNSVYFQRAAAAYQNAMEIAGRANAPEIETAARAGLAQVQGPWLGQWGQAATNAEQIPLDFAFQAVYTAGTTADFNQIVYITDGASWRDLTTWNTFYEDYYTTTGDPRARWEDTGRVDTPLGLPLFRTRKWTEYTDDVNLVSGREMVLIRAEALLQDGGDWNAALPLINSLREDLVSDHDGTPIPLHAASNLEETWTALKEERKIELWLEGRRMGDLRRWIAASTPGDMEDMSSRIRLCAPLANTERINNPNIPIDFQDPTNPIYSGS